MSKYSTNNNVSFFNDTVIKINEIIDTTNGKADAGDITALETDVDKINKGNNSLVPIIANLVDSIRDDLYDDATSKITPSFITYTMEGSQPFDIDTGNFDLGNWVNATEVYICGEQVNPMGLFTPAPGGRTAIDVDFEHGSPSVSIFDIPVGSYICIEINTTLADTVVKRTLLMHRTG